ncbi:hypothetical protein [Sphingomonas sp. PP-F2F-A104-K0414]|uniref:hypothetical protein n=1 Tax=Sphingomonas sp. PP-F2F-A104-K0414 TaxID=2135661 RepID=UPI00104938EA|nr:hypothetical protein [Sphingomonas sp. PP-F2F-A104-K0414]
MALDHFAVGPGDALGLAGDRAEEQRFGDDRPRDELGGVPAERERSARRAATQRVGGTGREADAGAGFVDGGALGDAFEEAALAIRGPAVAALGVAGRGCRDVGARGVLGLRGGIGLRGYGVIGGGLRGGFGFAGLLGGLVEAVVLESGGHLRMVRASAIQRSRLAAISGDTGMRAPIRPASTCACQAMTWRSASGRWSGIGGSYRGRGAGVARVAM